MKRLVQDHLRYSDELMCDAARVVAEIRDRARRRNPHFNPDGLFDTMHIRRGDFQQQYTSTQVNASVLYESRKDD